jgi:hypothetical protein
MTTLLSVWQLHPGPGVQAGQGLPAPCAARYSHQGSKVGLFAYVAGVYRVLEGGRCSAGLGDQRSRLDAGTALPTLRVTCLGCLTETQ